MSVPTVQQSVDAAVAAIEANLGQDVPTYEKAFLRVIAVTIGMTNAEIYRFGVQRYKQVLALTARGDDLTDLGTEYGVIRKAEEKAVVEVSISLFSAAPGVIAKTDTLRSIDNELYYFPIDDYPFTALDTEVRVLARCEFAGAVGNLPYGSEMDFGYQPTNASQFGIVESVETSGSDEETDDELRVRILDEVQSVGGGSNLADYRTWGQRAPNVRRIDPYTGRDPWTTSEPGWRTVFVESTESYNPDGIADSALLEVAEEYVNYDQETGKRNPCLGSTDDTVVYVSITRVTAYFLIHNLKLDDTAKTLDCQNAINDTLDTLVRDMRAFLMGLDAEVFRKDVLTSSFIAREVQRVVQAFGGSVGTVDVGLAYGEWVQSYTLNPGERLKATKTDGSSSVSYVG